MGGRESEIVCATSSWSRAVSPVRNRASGRLVSVPALASRGRNERERGAERSEREGERERENEACGFLAGSSHAPLLYCRPSTAAATHHHGPYTASILTLARHPPTHSTPTTDYLTTGPAYIHSTATCAYRPTYPPERGHGRLLKRAFHPIPTRRLGSILQHCFGQQYAAIQVNSTGYIAETVVIETCELETRLRTRRAVISRSTVVLHHEALDSHASTD